MNDPNPYSAPQSQITPQLAGDKQFQFYDFERLKKLYYRSCNINAIAFLQSLGLLAILALIFVPALDVRISKGFFLILAGFYFVSIIGISHRTSWGRILGIITSLLSLINVPLGTLIGIFGLFAFFGAPELFGEGRLTHKALKAEFKLQKRNLKRR